MNTAFRLLMILWWIADKGDAVIAWVNKAFEGSSWNKYHAR